MKLVTTPGDPETVTLPEMVASAVGLKDGDEIYVWTYNGKVIIQSSRDSSGFGRLLDDERGASGEVDWGPARGREVW